MAQGFTREQPYELVWWKPMPHLAKEFGLSDVALHKVFGSCSMTSLPFTMRHLVVTP